MKMNTMNIAAQLAAQADEALAAANWETARRLFSEALAQEVTPEALEGMARARVSLNDGAAARSTHASARTAPIVRPGVRSMPRASRLASPEP
jgi:hypothetical protein